MDTIRSAAQHDEAFLLDMLYEALFVPPGCQPFPRSVLDASEVVRYAAVSESEHGDVGSGTEAEANPAGAARAHLLRSDDRGTARRRRYASTAPGVVG